MKRFIFTGGTVLLGSALLTGCVEHRTVYVHRAPVVVAPAPPPAIPPPVTAAPVSPLVLAQAPPRPPAEPIIASPGPRYVYVPGYWSWQGRWVWVRGSWVARPRPHAVWSSGHWVHRHPGWVWLPGYWH